MKYYVYILKDGDIPFYVGKGTGKRMYIHKYEATKKGLNRSVHSKIKSMLSKDREIIYEVPFRTDDPKKALAEEIRLIREFGRKDLGTGTLTNLTDGGEGVIDYIWTEERRKQQSDALKRACVEGRHTPKGFLGPHPPTSEETRKKLSESGKKYYQSPEGMERRKRQSLSKKGKKRVLSEEARQKMRESALRTNRLKKLKKQHNTS